MAKEILLAEHIAGQTEHLDGGANIRAINKLYRAQDESNLWPICGRFNATDKAIQRVRKFTQNYGEKIYGLEYCYAIENEISSIVNNF